jgi:hypothetical protein
MSFYADEKPDSIGYLKTASLRSKGKKKIWYYWYAYLLLEIIIYLFQIVMLIIYNTFFFKTQRAEIVAIVMQLPHLYGEETPMAIIYVTLVDSTSRWMALIAHWLNPKTRVW